MKTEIKGWRTVAAAAANMAAMLWEPTREQFRNNPELFAAFQSFVFIWLRSITDTPIGKRSIPAYQTAGDIARGELGVKEYRGEADNPRVVEYLKSVKKLSQSAQRSDETPWCSAFVNWCVQKAGGKGTDSAAARSWLYYGEPVSHPEKGDIVILWRGSREGWKGHVGFYQGGNGDTVSILGGNQNDAVTVADYPRERVLGFRRI